MPGMTGFDLARKLRERLADRDMHLVALTGMGRRSDIEQTRDAGFCAHLTKPARVEDVIEVAARSSRAPPQVQSAQAASES
jgi:CheY-like chemotaxis protein